jgi:hypothetical protein
MKATLNITLPLLGVSGLYIFFYYPLGYAILTASIAVVAYVMTNELTASLGVAVFMIFLRWIGNALQPITSSSAAARVAAAAGKEGFQAKDPITIHQRITKEKSAVPPVRGVTGVLESPSILGSLHIGTLSREEEGFTNSTLPASVNAPSTGIPTPAENSVPANGSPDTAPMSNPALITGADPDAVQTAMVNKGSALANGPMAANMGATTSGPAPYA